MKILRNLFKGKGNYEGSATVLKTSNSQNQYYCPMKCEGDKTYDASGNCPVCNMKLVPVDSAVSTHHSHEHNGRSHHGCC